MIKKICLSVFVLATIILAQEKLPNAMREMRAVWVATVANIDWPSRPGLTVEEQKIEAVAILDRIKQLNMNAVILQVRPQADAFYKSELEPWSYYLTGEQGKPPEPFYDPLEFWIKESHSRGLELHAWLNPYRANHSAMRGEISEKSIVKAKPHLVRKLGNAGYYWMDPSMKEVQDHSYNVAIDIVKRYKVDAIHFDDYFYPYTEYNDGKDFPDTVTYQEYKSKGGKLDLGDWRREAVNKFIKRLYTGIKKENKSVKFGISPFGVYRPGYPESITLGFDQYATLYADARLWLNKGWIDYYTPQLYWNISRINLSYPVLLGWWQSENKKERNLFPGLFIRPEIQKKDMALEIVNQVMVTRGMLPQKPGTMLFSMKSLMDKDSISTGQSLMRGPFAKQALVPPSKWLDSKPLESPKTTLIKTDSTLKISWEPKGKEIPFLYVLYTLKNNRWDYEIFPAKTTEVIKLTEKTNISAYILTAVDINGNESKKKIFRVE